MKRWLAAGLIGASVACGPRPGAVPHGVAELREVTQSEADAETLARWLLAELVAPGGNAAGAEQARLKLDASRGDHYLAHFARALDDAWHGRLRAAPGHFLSALEAARQHETVESRLVAWFAATQAAALSARDPAFWTAARERVKALMDAPGGIGWRARAHLVEWWLDQTARVSATSAAHSIEELGCVTALRLAGPFGSAAPAHLRRSFPPEEPGPWRTRWPLDASSGVAPELLETRQRGCEITSSQPVPAGVYYAEAFFELPAATDVILAAQSAISLWIDDRRVLDRDPVLWGVWPRFGVHMRLAAGRHRVVARLPEAHTLLRVMRPDGTPLPVRAAGSSSAPYARTAPELLEDPNDLMRFIDPTGVRGDPEPLHAFLAAELAHVEGEDDVASVLGQRLTEPRASATGPSLASLASFADGDPAYARAEAADRVRALYEAALTRDPALWRAELGAILGQTSSGSLAAAVPPLRELTRRFAEAPAVWSALGVVLGRLGWVPEQRHVLLQMVERFPDAGALVSALPVYEQRGELDLSARARERILELDAGSHVVLERELARRNYPAALRELERLARREPERRAEFELRRQEILVAAGDGEALIEKLESAVAAAPQSGSARLALADARRAAGDSQALHAALAAATEAGAATGPLARAIDAVEARSDFSPFRLDGRQAIQDYERADRHLSASAARVLDYAAVWVHSDGSSRMLEHEIVRIQSAEAISKFAEQPKPAGLVLQMRVIKRDGRSFEPEEVDGKPTVTFPHLEVGDYVETEHVQGFPASDHGQYYPGLRWFFREDDVAYSRSEFVLIAPTHRPLDIEITGSVPEPQITRDGLFITRRWRVDDSPAAPVEPLSPPVQEFLPSVRVGWGNGLERRLRLLSETVADVSPVDPRIRALAQRVVQGVPASEPRERARRAYRWVQENIKDESELDGRKVLTSKQGNRWSALRMLLRALDIPVSYGLVKNRLAAKPAGVMSEAEAYGVPLLYVGKAPDAAWLSVEEKYGPFGYVPVEARGMPGYVLAVDRQLPMEVPAAGDQDRLEYQGTVRLNERGSAVIELTQRFVGKYAMRLRAGLEQVPQGRLHEVIQSRLLGQALPGAQLLHHEISNEHDLDAPLELAMRVALGRFAEVSADRMVIEPPLMPQLSQLATLPSRQTPLLIGEAMHQSARLSIRLPPGARVWGAQQGRVEEKDFAVSAQDRVEDGLLVLDREVSIAAGRVSPEDYAAFAEFTRRGERLLAQPIVIRLAGEGSERARR